MKIRFGLWWREYKWAFGIMYESYLGGGCMITIMLGILCIDILIGGINEENNP